MTVDYTEPAPPRYHALDALRGFALLLGVFYHVAESFEPDHWQWAIVDQDPSEVLRFLRYVSHCFRMEVFFLLAGFFARLVVLKRGTKSFAKNRFWRIFVPLIVGWLVMFPLLVLIWIAGAQKSGNYQFIAIPEEARDLALWKLWIGFMLSGGVVRNFSLTHLWFLHQLLVIYLLVGLARGLWTTWDPQGRHLRRSGSLLKRVLGSRAGFVALAIPTVGFLFLMPGWNVSTAMHSVIPEIGTTLLYSLLYTVAMWGLTLGFLGMFLGRIRGESAFWRYVADSSYWVYLAHLPVVVTLQIWVAHWPIRWPIKHVVICGVALPVLYLSYHYLVRSTFIGQQLNGKRLPLRFTRPTHPRKL